MTVLSPRSLSRVIAAFRSLSFFAVSVGSLALFLMVASLLLISNSSGLTSTINGYLLGINQLKKPSLELIGDNQTKVLFQWQEPSENGYQGIVMDEFESGSEVPDGLAFTPTLSSDESQEVGKANNSVSTNGNENMELSGLSSASVDDSRKNGSEIDSDGLASLNLTVAVAPLPSPPSDNFGESKLRSCDLYHGKWMYDTAGPLYTNNSCPILTQSQNCQGNGRPDKDYENWRWKPDQCDLPWFDARKFLELMRGKTLAFVGDSIARNQMESMLCILWQVEAPINRGNRQMHRWYFRSTSTTIVRIWSAWLVHKTSESLPSASQKVVKVHLDAPDEAFMEYLPKFDVVVLSSGHWFSKQSAYVLNGTIVGGQLGHPKRSHNKKQIDNVKAYGISIETILTAISNLANYTGLTIVRSYSPDHYEGGAWNTGGSCAGIIRPATKLVRNGYTNAMHEKQVSGFERVAKKVTNGSKLRLMDITEVSGYRHDGHPGPYRSPSSNKVTKGGRNGKPPSEDCLHWCMPGPVDTWNEILFEVIRREF